MPTLTEKLHPRRFAGMSGFMERLLAYMMNNVYYEGELPHDAFTGTAWTSEGYLMISHVEDGGLLNRFHGVTPTQLRYNFRKLFDTAELTDAELEEAKLRFFQAFRITLDE